MTRKLLTTVVVCLLVGIGTAFGQTGSISGTVTDAQSGNVLPGANVVIEQLQRGSPVNGQGKYEITDLSAGTYTVKVTFIGYNESSKTVELSAGENVTVDFALQAGVDLGEVVVTALGQEQSEASISFSSQEVSEDQLNIAPSNNVKNSLAGKVSGVQILGQAGSKLGSFGGIRIRGAISLTDAESEPLYVVDGVPVNNPNVIDMNNVQNVNVLKGPNATALYGQRGENGVVIISTKQSAESGISVELNNSFTIEQPSYLPNYQNKYGQGYLGQGEWRTFNYDASKHVPYFEALDGKTALSYYWADESWGPKFDGRQYAPWYSWFPDSPYYGETIAWESRPNNVKNFFDRGTTNKGGFAINAVGDSYSGRISYTNLSQSGLIPYSGLDKHYMSGRFSYDITDDFNVGVNLKYTMQDVYGDVRSDDYANPTSGSFNQWFGRQLNVKRLKELRDLKTPAGTQANWNWWGPDGNYPYSGSPSNSDLHNRGLKSPTFWFNPYKWQEEYKINHDRNNLLLNLDATYQFNDQVELTANSNITREDYRRRYEVPYTFQFSSDQSGALYNHFVNSFGERTRTEIEYNHTAKLNYQNDFGDFSVEVLGGGTARIEHYKFLSAEMSMSNYTSGGLIMPNVYSFSNSKERIVPNESDWDKRVYSLFTKAKIGYKDYLYLDGSYRQDWSSALPSSNNGYGYPQVGVSFVFSELVDIPSMSYGKVRAGWAQVGDDVDAEDLLTHYRLDSNAYFNPQTGSQVPLLYTDDVTIDSPIKPALNTSYETGFDIRFFNDRLGLKATYYKEKRKDEIIGIALSTASGVDDFITNAGSSEREGVELTLNGVPVQTQNFRWDITANWAMNQTIVTNLPRGLQSYQVNNAVSDFGVANIVHEVGKEWGQLRGPAIARNDQGEPIVLSNNDYYKVEQGHNYGSVLPDWTGGFINTFSYKNLSLTAAVDFQKGGQFFSLSELWGWQSGLYKETAQTNDLGNPVRDPVYDSNGNLLPKDVRGGVHVTGVNPDGDKVDRYVAGNRYYGQFGDNFIAEPFIHPADYIKLRSLNLSYSLPKRWIGSFLNSAKVGVVAENVWMIAVHPDNNHGWDPSELAEPYGENGQLPGTRSYGINVSVTF